MVRRRLLLPASAAMCLAAAAVPPPSAALSISRAADVRRRPRPSPTAAPGQDTFPCRGLSGSVAIIRMIDRGRISRDGSALRFRGGGVGGADSPSATGLRAASISADEDDHRHRQEREREAQQRLPRSLLPITLGVFAQMLGEGISLSSLPLHLTKLGASPVTVGLAISCFSICQMTFAPLLVRLSSRVGRSRVLRLCLVGAAASSLLIALSRNVCGVIAGRALAGVFAAGVPVAQSAVTDVLTQEHQMALGLSRVSAAAQLGVVVGPLVSATFQEAFGKLGLTPELRLPAVFVLNAINALFVLVQMSIIDRRSGESAERDEAKDAKAMATRSKSDDETDDDIRRQDTISFAQPMLRTITIIVGWTAILSNSIYGLFAPRAMGFRQPQLSATYSTAAILMVLTQIVFPRLVDEIGEHRACTLGILAAGTGIGGQSLVRVQPLHTLLYMMNRAGAAVADTSTAALVASSSTGREDRSRNLALLTSTRAAARIFSPLISGKLFELSLRSSTAPGALPFVAAACLCMAVAPFPSVLNRAQRWQKRQKRRQKLASKNRN